MNSLTFFVVHHATSELHTYVLDKCISSIKLHHPESKIIICKTSTSNIPVNLNVGNIEIVNTPIDSTHVYGGLYMLVDRTDIENYVFLHDSMVLLKRLPDEIFNKRFYFLWHFDIYPDDCHEIVRSLVDNICILSPDSKQSLLYKFYNKFVEEWRGLFGPAFGGNFKTLQLFWNTLNVNLDTLHIYLDRRHLRAAERYFSLVANELNIIDNFENSYSLNDNIELCPNAFHATYCTEEVDNILNYSHNSCNAYMCKFWLLRQIIPKEQLIQERLDQEKLLKLQLEEQKPIARVAICLRGAMSKLTERFCNPGALYNQGKYVNYVAVYNSIKKHIIDANPNVVFDFFIQSWNLDLEDQLIDLYKPKSFLFENNDLYRDEIINCLNITNKPLTDFSINSQFLSISKTIKIMKNYIEKEKYTNNNEITYDSILLYRPDVLLFKDMDLLKYDKKSVYVNGHSDSGGDFHFLMSLEDSYKFMHLYETTKFVNLITNHYLHGKIRIYVENVLQKKLLMDNIKPGLDQEVLRKLKICSVDQHQVPIDTFYKYGLNQEEILSYNIN